MKTKEKTRKINVVSLGCSKNLVDSETLMAQLEANDFQVVHDGIALSDIVIINTCGFITDAKQESVDTILEYVHAKEKGLIQELYVMGCLTQRYKEDLKELIPGVDRYFGVDNLRAVIREIGGKYRTELIGERRLATPNHYAYLKISEGCDRKCTFCAIPLIRGRHKSKSINEVLKEAGYLAEKGVKEIILIAQDLSYYGYDIYRKQQLPLLIDELSKIRGIEWIRLHYAYPAGFPGSVLNVMMENSKICKYLDIPIQHINNRILSLMQRGHSKEETIRLLNKIRNEVPGIALRTTLIVGFPGETREEFNELVDFVKKFRFDRLGIFPYSAEEGTKAFKLPDNIPANVKTDRMEKLMCLQKDISLELNTAKIGKVFPAIIDREESEFYIGRTESDSPEVDNEVLIQKQNHNLLSGEFYTVMVTKADYYDIFGEVAV
jgi:ribosomal protein S12 methylthiotransferase